MAGVYHSGDEVNSALPDALNEVFGDFFSPDNLFVSLLLARSTPDCEVYFCTRRGGLLRYKSEKTEAEATLLTEVTLFNGTDSELKGQLFAAELSALDYVRRVALAGQLEVMVSDTVWTHAGLVNETWEPFASEAEVDATDD